MRCGVVQFEVGQSASFDSFVSRVDGLVSTAREEGAEIVAFPEYLSVDLVEVAAGRGLDSSQMPDAFLALDGLYEEYVEAMASIARDRGVLLIAGSFPRRQRLGGARRGEFHNAAQIHFPDGRHLEQQKLHTAYELGWNQEQVRPGSTQLLFDYRGARVAVLVCYDAQFPETGRAILERGPVDILVVVGCAMVPWGAWRVATAAGARAMECISFALNSQLAGRLPFPADKPYRFWARSSLHSPISAPFSPDGVVSVAEPNVEGVIVSELDVDLLKRTRDSAYPELKKRGAPIDVEVV